MSTSGDNVGTTRKNWRDLRPGDEVMSYGEPVYTVQTAPRPESGCDHWTVKVRLGRTGPMVRVFQGHLSVEVTVRRAA